MPGLPLDADHDQALILIKSAFAGCFPVKTRTLLDRDLLDLQIQVFALRGQLQKIDDMRSEEHLRDLGAADQIR